MLPILDISEYLQNPDGDASHQFVELLRETCHGPGFFYLVGHGIDQQVSDNTLAVANQFRTGAIRLISARKNQSRNTVRMIRHGFAYAVRISGPPVFPRCPAQSEPGWIMYSRLVWH